MNQTATAPYLGLDFGGRTIAVESNDSNLIDRLRRYFSGFVAPLTPAQRHDSLLRAFEEPESEPRPDLVPWAEKGKESFVDTSAGRYVRKVRTGVSITIHEDMWTSDWSIRGALQRNFSQVVNLICTMYGMSLIDQFGAMLHASAVSDASGRAYAVVGQSGMGKSSVCVRLLENGFDYISNDRLILLPEHEGRAVQAHGLPKLPRVNPGTLLASERTKTVLAPEQRRRYQNLPREELWNLEDKSDLEVEEVLGRRWLLSGRLACMFVLGWRHSGEGLSLQRLNAGQALDELRQASKNFGAFDLRLGDRKDSALVESVKRLPVYRVTGKSDPTRLANELTPARLAELAEA